MSDDHTARADCIIVSSLNSQGKPDNETPSRASLEFIEEMTVIRHYLKGSPGGRAALSELLERVEREFGTDFARVARDFFNATDPTLM